MSKTTVIAIAVVVLTFAAGFAAGIFSAHVMILRGVHGMPPFPAEAIVNRLDRRLDLTDTQRKQVEEIIRRRHAHIRSIGGEVARMNAEIEKVLTPEQREKFARLRSRRGLTTSSP